jgi:hypothetical protein
MKNINAFVASAVVAFASSTVFAQSTAVQWTVASGGNGHWYGRLTGTYPFDHSAISTAAQAIGAHLVALSSATEEQFVLERLGAGLLGLRAAQGSASFQWTNGEPLNYANWGTSSCYSGPYPNNPSGQQRFVFQSHPECAGSQGFAPSWDDYSPIELGSGIVEPAVEWSADCNADGIVDYGQCHDGTLPDYDGNNIPDCCERSEACVVGNYPVQWRIEDSGNGHWYGMHAINQADMTWMQMREAATRLGGHLITLSGAEEDAFGFRYFAGLHTDMMPGPLGYFVMPGGQWESVTGEPISYSNWRPAMTQPPLAAAPDNGNTLHRFATWLDPSWGLVAGRWEDWHDSELGNPADPVSRFLIEWDADCNNDGIVDYGQILSGQLIDTNGNGVPDVCDVDP